MSLLDRRTLILTGAAALIAGPAAAYQVPNHLRPRIVDIRDRFRPNEIHVDPGHFALYWTLPNGKAIRYSVGIGVCQRSCPVISCGVSDFRGADFVFWVEPDGSGGLPVSGFA